MSKAFAIFLTVILAGAGAVVAVPVTGRVFEYFHWPIFHTWGIMHGSICVLFPVCFLLFGGIAWLILRKFVKKSTPE
jgi:hypothetical protein